MHSSFGEMVQVDYGLRMNFEVIQVKGYTDACMCFLCGSIVCFIQIIQRTVRVIGPRT